VSDVPAEETEAAVSGPKGNPATDLLPPLREELIARLRERSSLLEPVPTGEEPSAPGIPGLRAVLFDIYGTLVVSGSGDVGTAAATDSAEAFAEALAAAGLAGDLCALAAEGPDRLETAIKQVHAARRGEGIAHPEVDILATWEDILAQWREAGRVQLPSERAGIDPLPAAAARAAVEYEARVNPTWSMPGAGQTLAKLRERGIPLGIVSNAQFYTPLLLEALFDASLEGLGFRPDLCSFSFRLGEAKPSAALFAAPLAKLKGEGVPPRSILYVGNDMRNDVHTAAAVGCRTALFAGDRRSLRWRDGDTLVGDRKPDAVVTDLAMVLNLLDLCD
jgi:putative hydrolase of the HAD superfamily